MPPADTPETAFNEMDLPLTLSQTLLPRVTVWRPIADTVPAPSVLARPRGSEISRLARVAETPLKSRGPSLQPLLCTFLI